MYKYFCCVSTLPHSYACITTLFIEHFLNFFSHASLSNFTCFSLDVTRFLLFSTPPISPAHNNLRPLLPSSSSSPPFSPSTATSHSSSRPTMKRDAARDDGKAMIGIAVMLMRGAANFSQNKYLQDARTVTRLSKGSVQCSRMRTRCRLNVLRPN